MGLTLIAASCTSSGGQDLTPTTTLQPVAPVTTAVSSTTAADTTTTTEVASQITPPRYRIVERTATEAPGDTVVVLLDDTSYDSLTDIDIYDIIAEVVELFPPISEIHVVDDAAAANTVTDPEATEADIAAVQANYLARLDNGFTITYLGPFAASGSSVLGS